MANLYCYTHCPSC